MPTASRNAVIAALAAFISIVAIAILAWRAGTPVPSERPATAAHGAAKDAAKNPDPGAGEPNRINVPSSPGAGDGRPKAATAPRPENAARPESASAPQVPPQPAAPSLPAPEAPSFDVVRVEPTGETVVAGRAAPGSLVTLMASGKPAGRATADAGGQFVIIPDPLPPGGLELSLTVRGPAGEQQSLQSVAVSVPLKGSSQEVIVALAEPGKPTQILSDPRPAQSPAGQPGGRQSAGASNQAPPTPPIATANPPQQTAAATPGNPPTPDSPRVAIRSVETEQGSGFFASGQAPPGALVRLYLNDTHVADVTADAAGHWTLRITRGLAAGNYRVRADQVERATGAVVTRAEVPFILTPQLALAEQRPTPHAQADHAPSGDALGPKAGVPSAPSARAEPTRETASAAALPDQPAPAAGLPGAASAATAPDGSAPTPPVVAGPSAKPNGQAMKQPATAPTAIAQADPAHVTIEQIVTATVTRGDSLWRISRKMLGRGVRYTQIYDANTDQIRDPRLIYPGQILVVPGAEPASRR